MTESHSSNSPDDGDTCAHLTRRLAADSDEQRTAESDDHWSAESDHNGTADPVRDAQTATRYWLANTWVEALPDGECFISPYEGGEPEQGTLAATTEAALSTVAFRIDRGVPLVHTAAWADPDRRIPALDDRNPVRDAVHRFPACRRSTNDDPSEPMLETAVTDDDSRQVEE